MEPVAGVRVMLAMLQLCRPLSGAVRTPDGAAPTGSSARFNCAAPFRERLASRLVIADEVDLYASIVPPPFGSG